MRRSKIKEIESVIQTLFRAQDEALRMLEKGRGEEVFLLMTQCQECALEIGTVIEDSCGEGLQTISCLENYCEQLYQMTCLDSLQEAVNLKKQIEDTLFTVRETLRKEIPLSPFKIVFMPYKASMWDCMESVWEAAKSDAECEVYVVPIPFYERNPDGSVANVCYEGEKFPSYVKITSYREFRLEQECPDVIYIHNPYDGANFVTGVHPDYYSDKLKRYTDLLVYIPYFIAGNGPLPKTHLNLPAYAAVDFVILQDEEKKASLLGRVQEEKLLVIGNPKIDRLLRLKEGMDSGQKDPIPAAWRRKAGGKKIFLYNVSISGILENSIYAMKKLRYVMAEFEKREDAVLLWRPHPLIEGTLKSMRPELYQEYMNIKADFMDRGKGILDETADAAASAAFADAYIGESTSSMVHYFGILGKPVYYIRWETLQEKSEEERCSVSFYDYYKEKEGLYFVPIGNELSGYLCRQDLKTGRVEVERALPGRAGCSGFCIAKAGKRIGLPSADEKGDIYVYDLENDSAVKVILKHTDAGYGRQCMIRIVEYQGEFFITPGDYPAIVKLNPNTYEITEYTECISRFLEEGAKNGQFPMWGLCVKENLLYVPSPNNGSLLIFDMDTGDYRIKSLGDFNYGFCGITYDENCFWLGANGQNAVIQWDEDTGEAREYRYPVSCDEKTVAGCASTLLSDGEELLIFHSGQREIVIMNKQDGSFKSVCPAGPAEGADGRALFGNNIAYIFAKKWTKEEIIAFDRSDRSILLWDRKTHSQVRFPVRLEKKYVIQAEKRKIENGGIKKGYPYYAGQNMGIEMMEFVDYVVNSRYPFEEELTRKYAGIIKNFYDGAGKRIHDYMKKRLSKKGL